MADDLNQLDELPKRDVNHVTKKAETAFQGWKALAEDYARMADDGLLLQEAEPLNTLIERCGDIAARANSAVVPSAGMEK